MYKFVITSEDGEQFVPGIDGSNFLSLIDIIPLRQRNDVI